MDFIYSFIDQLKAADDPVPYLILAIMVLLVVVSMVRSVLRTVSAILMVLLLGVTVMFMTGKGESVEKMYVKLKEGAESILNGGASYQPVVQEVDQEVDKAVSEQNDATKENIEKIELKEFLEDSVQSAQKRGDELVDGIEKAVEKESKERK